MGKHEMFSSALPYSLCIDIAHKKDSPADSEPRQQVPIWQQILIWQPEP